MAGRFKDSVVVITGGGRGIGRATALAFGEEGATCVIAGRRMDALETTAGEVRHSGGVADVIHCDVLKEADLNALVGKTMDAHGRIDVLVNNAGVVTGGRLDEISKDDVDRMVGVNVWAPLRLTQLVLPHMRERKSGAIVNISSVAGRMGIPYYATYCASKYAMRGFSESLRRELRPDNIHVMAVFPGGTATDMIENVDFARFGVSVATAQQVGNAILRGVQWRQPEVFIGLGESLLSRWNDFMPWTVDLGVDLVREQFRAAVKDQRTV
jgi:NAD(P)-dependent dehydrogenase (short-subunit alcohol dehydrogenase family)